MTDFTPRSKPAASCDRAIDDRSRALRFDNLPTGSKQFSLKLVDYYYDEYHIPLGDLDTQPMQDEPPAEISNVYIPVDLKRYTFPEATGAPQLPDDVEALLHDRRHRQFTDQLRPGWIYIFRHGYLWRELRVVEPGKFEEINLTEYKGQDDRPATTETIYHPILPYKLNGKVQLLEIAYSEIQWTWAYINYFGGMDPDDPRLTEGSKPGPEFHHQLPAGTPKPPARARRMQNITPHLAKADSLQFEAAEIEPLPEKPDSFDWFKLHNQDYLFTVYVLDPIGVARSLANDVATMQYDMLACKALARKDPKYTMAQLVHQLTIQEPKYKKYIDDNEVLGILRWDDYIKILKRFDLATQALGDYLGAGPYANANAGMTVATAMADYWVTAGTDYLQGLRTLAELLANLQLMSGATRLEKIFQENSPLIKNALNPDQSQIQTLVQDHLEAAAVLIQNIAGAAVMHKSVSKYVFEYSQTLISKFTHGKYTLEKTQVNLTKVLAAEENAPKALNLLKQSYHYDASTDAKITQWMTVKAGVTTEDVEVPLGRSIKWLQANEPLVRSGAIGFMMALQAVNLGEQIVGVSSQDQSYTEMAATVSKLLGLNFELIKEIRSIKIEKLNLPEESEKLLLSKTIGKVTILAHGLSFLGDAISVCLDFNQAWKNFKKGNKSLGTLSLINAFGDSILTSTGLITGASVLMKLTIGEWLGNIRMITAITEWGQESIEMGLLGIELSFLSILTMIGFAILIIAAILIYLFTNTPLEKWLIYGPFGKDKSRRYLGPENDGEKEWASWRDPVIAQQALFNLLYGFAISHFSQMKQIGINMFMPTNITIYIYCPLFIPGKSVLYFQLEGKHAGHHGYEPQDVSDPKSHVRFHAASQKPTTLTIDYAVKYFTYRFTALLDLYGDGRIIIPTVFQQGHASDQPKEISFMPSAEAPISAHPF